MFHRHSLSLSYSVLILPDTLHADAMVMTRAQTRRNVTIEDKDYQKDVRSQVQLKPIVDTATSSEHSSNTRSNCCTRTSFLLSHPNRNSPNREEDVPA